MNVTSGTDGAFALHADLRLQVDGTVATLLMCRGRHNYFDAGMIDGLADAVHHLDALEECRAIVLASGVRSFCAGADFSEPGMSRTGVGANLYPRALRLFQGRKPIVAAVHGAAIGGGVGLSLVADFRIVGPGTRMTVNFCRLGIHPGFGISCTLPRLVGIQKAASMLYTGQAVSGEEAVGMGLADILTEDDRILATAQAFAQDIATSAPLAVMATRSTLRRGLVDDVKAAMDHEIVEQDKHWLTSDFNEGVAAARERRMPRFGGR